jgi:hypothetical protein
MLRDARKMRAPQDEVVLTPFPRMVRDHACAISMIKKGVLVGRTQN